MQTKVYKLDSFIGRLYKLYCRLTGQEIQTKSDTCTVRRILFFLLPYAILTKTKTFGLKIAPIVFVLFATFVGASIVFPAATQTILMLVASLIMVILTTIVILVVSLFALGIISLMSLVLVELLWQMSLVRRPFMLLPDVQSQDGNQIEVGPILILGLFNTLISIIIVQRFPITTFVIATVLAVSLSVVVLLLISSLLSQVEVSQERVEKWENAIDNRIGQGATVIFNLKEDWQDFKQKVCKPVRWV